MWLHKYHKNFEAINNRSVSLDPNNCKHRVSYSDSNADSGRINTNKSIVCDRHLQAIVTTADKDQVGLAYKASK